MKKNLILIFIMLFILTGCDAVVNVDINKDSITEKVTATAKDNNEYNDFKNWNGFPLPMYFENSSPYNNSPDEKDEGISYYDNKFDDESKQVYAQATFDLNNYNKSTLVKSCFERCSIVPSEDGISTIFYAGEGLTCKFNNFKIVVKTPYKVTYNNASSVDTGNNTYTWIVDSKNNNKINIYLKIDFSHKYDGSSADTNTDTQNDVKDTEDTKEKETKSPNYKLYVTLAIIGIFSLIGILIVLKKKKEAVSKL